MAKPKVISVANQKGGVFLTMANETNFRKDIVAAVKSNFGKHSPVIDVVIPEPRMKSRLLATGKHISLTTRVLQNKS